MGTQVTEPAATSPATADWQANNNKSTLMGKGLCKVSIDEMGTTAEPEIQAGSLIEVNGAYFLSSTAESITGWSGIPNDTWNVYIKCVVSGTTCSYAFTATAPTWDDAKQGLYSGSDRYILVKLSRGASSSDYENKRNFENIYNGFYQDKSFTEDGEFTTLTSDRWYTAVTAPTENTIYDKLRPAFSYVGQYLPINGSCAVSKSSPSKTLKSVVWSRMTLSASNAIALKGLAHFSDFTAGSGSAVAISDLFQDGDATIVEYPDWDISW